MASIGAIFSSTYHTKQLNPWPNSSASHVVVYSWLSGCPCRGDGAIQRSPEHLRMSDTNLRNKPQQNQLGNFKYQYLPKNLLANVYRYHVMVLKSVLLLCVCVCKPAFLTSNHIKNIISLMLYSHQYTISMFTLVLS